MTCEDLLDLVGKRRSIRRLQPEPIPDDIVLKIIVVGRPAINPPGKYLPEPLVISRLIQ